MDDDKKQLSVGRNVKIGFFHLGSGMADVLTTGVWNRIMISDLGFAATPIGLLVSLRYFLAPLGIWAGRISDRRTILGFRRLFWIWLGRLMMVLSTVLLGYETYKLAQNPGSVQPADWVAMALALLLFSFGSAISGSTFLALIYDRSGADQRGRAVGIVWTFLLLGFTIGGIVFGALLPTDDNPSELSFAPESVLTLFLVAAGIFSALWFFSLLGEERRRKDVPALTDEQKAEEDRRFFDDLALVWRNRSMRYFFFFLTISMFFAFSQDLVLEPFAGDVFGMEARVTNRFSAYWGSMAILGTVLFLWLQRRVAWLNNTNLSALGVLLLTATFAVFAVSSVFEVRGLVTPGLILLGLGLGMWNVGTLGLMMDMSPTGQAGTFLGFWTLSVTFARGGGVAGGGIIRDIWLQITGSMEWAYGIVFIAGTIGLVIALICLTRISVSAFKDEMSQEDRTAGVFAGAMD